MSLEMKTFPSAFEAVFLVVALFIAEYLVGAALFDMRAISGMDPRELDGAIAVLGNGILFSALLQYKRLSYRSLFHPSANSVIATVGTLSLPILLIVPALMLSMWAVQAALESLFPMARWQELMFDRMISGSFASVVTVCVLAPILEEMLFRGVILRSFLHQYSRQQAVLGSAVLFGLAHMNLYQFVAGVVLGIVSGWLYERSRSLWPCILLHASYNSAVTWLYMSLGSLDARAIWAPDAVQWGVSIVMAFFGASALQRLLAHSDVVRRSHKIPN